MTDDRSNGTVVADIIGLRIEERGLQDGSREVDAIEQRVLEGVYRLRRASHLGLIYRLAPMLTEIGST